MSTVPEPFRVYLRVLSTVRPALMAEGTRFLDAVRTAPPYQLAVSPTPGLHQQVCVEQGSFVGRRVSGFGSSLGREDGR